MKTWQVVSLVFVCTIHMAHAATETVNGITWRYSIVDGEVSLGGGSATTQAVTSDTKGDLVI